MLDYVFSRRVESSFKEETLLGRGSLETFFGLFGKLEMIVIRINRELWCTILIVRRGSWEIRNNAGVAFTRRLSIVIETSMIE